MTKRKKLLLIIIPLCLLALCAAGLGIYYANWGSVSIDRTDMMAAGRFNGMPYRIYMPQGEGPFPLVLYLHGAGERGDNNRAQTKKNSVMQTLLSEENLEKYPCIVLAPQCPKNGWWDAEVLMDLLGAKILAAHQVDFKRIYITGLSMGGFGTWNMLGEYPNYFAAAVPVCGGGDTDSVPLFKHIPIWAFHGTLDTVVFPSGSRDMVTALARAGARDVHYTEYPDLAHNSWDRAYREPGLFPWMFAQVREAQIN